ncbi:enolase C-terminal domain-like protein [Microlunatus sp. GCM10028923]|uniref:enolase C-terminal domain-like protein n=1 Tax=Microlunatus sp. GCM10028923 TaxID=3273400 RepID=UPI003611859D
MKITDVSLELVDLPTQPQFNWRAGLAGSEGPTTGGILRLHTDAGITGEAHTRRGRSAAEAVDRWIRDDLVGLDPLDRELLWHRIWQIDRRDPLALPVFGLVDLAAWDLAGKLAGWPLWRLLGGFRTSIDAYASTVTYGSIDEYLDVADQVLARGFRAIKIHAWGDVDADAELAHRLRSHVGPGIPLYYDGSAGFDLVDAIRLGRALASAGFAWYEEPMLEYGVAPYSELARKVEIPLLVGETSPGSHLNAADFILAGAAGALRVSPHLKGGITGSLRIAHLADAFRLRAEVHAGGIVQQHLCMAIPNNSYYEALVWGNPIQTDPAVGSDGRIVAPIAPGIGW